MTDVTGTLCFLISNGQMRRGWRFSISRRPRGGAGFSESLRGSRDSRPHGLRANRIIPPSIALNGRPEILSLISSVSVSGLINYTTHALLYVSVFVSRDFCIGSVLGYGFGSSGYVASVLV